MTLKYGKLPKWHDFVPSDYRILRLAQRLTDDKSDGAYVVNKYRYSAQSHRDAARRLVDKGWLKQVRGENPYYYYEITAAGRAHLADIKMKIRLKKGIYREGVFA